MQIKDLEKLSKQFCLSLADDLDNGKISAEEAAEKIIIFLKENNV